MTFHQASASIAEPVTKFGGQPVWLGRPEWPLSKETGEQMRFMCQILIDPEIFGQVEGRMAYIFMTDGEEFVDGTYAPDGGENAVIIQPDGNNVTSTQLATGPSLYVMREKEDDRFLHPVPCEFSVELKVGNDIHRRFESETNNEDLQEVKIGGTPFFLQAEEYPKGDGWRLLLQIDSATVPFYVNFGDVGVGYAFLSADGRTGKFLWQCA